MLKIKFALELIYSGFLLSFGFAAAEFLRTALLFWWIYG